MVVPVSRKVKNQKSSFPSVIPKKRFNFASTIVIGVKGRIKLKFVKVGGCKSVVGGVDAAKTETLM
jgi:hypothetical protein